MDSNWEYHFLVVNVLNMHIDILQGLRKVLKSGGAKKSQILAEICPLLIIFLHIDRNMGAAFFDAEFIE